MAFRLICVLILIVFTALSQQASKPEDSYYVAGVVEFSPSTIPPSLAQLEDNLFGYFEVLGSPQAKDADIIIFPEHTLNNMKHLTYVPHPNMKDIPCTTNFFAPFFQQLSCVAQHLKKYLVFNLLEKAPCTIFSQDIAEDPRECSPDNENIYNTNVVLDRFGAVVARYRKFNVYGEPVNTTLKPELSTFTTDFGVKFGVFTCFDINFYSPAMDLVKDGVKDFIFTSFWYSELPFLTAVQLQQSWAYANNVNLLAAGASKPSVGATGSGIYAGKRGALVSVMTGTPERKLYVAKVPKMNHPTKTDKQLKALRVQRQAPKVNNPKGIRLMREYKMEEFTSRIIELDPEDSDYQERICHNEFCCSFVIEIKFLYPEPSEYTASYVYRIAAFEGNRKYSGYGYTEYRFCAIYACTNTTHDTCGMLFEDESIEVAPEYSFQNIFISGNFPTSDEVLYMPNSLDQNLYPLPFENSKFDVATYEKHITRVLYEYKNETNNLLTFGIYANYYNGNTSYHLYSMIILIMSVLVPIIVRSFSL